MQALRMRRAYVQCILKQDIGWFDEHPAGQLPTAVTANMAKVQDGLGRKVGDIVFNGLSGERGRPWLLGNAVRCTFLPTVFAEKNDAVLETYMRGVKPKLAICSVQL